MNVSCKLIMELYYLYLYVIYKRVISDQNNHIGQQRLNILV